MESRAKLFGHPVHQMLVPIPFGLLAMAVVFDLLALVLADGYWSEIADWMMAAGVVTGLLAGPFGLIDWLAIPSGRGPSASAPSTASATSASCCSSRAAG